MAVLRLRAAQESGTSESTIAIESGRMSAELTEDVGAPNASIRRLPAPELMAIRDRAENLAAAAISNIQELLGQVRISHDELRRTLDDLKRDRDEWRRRAEQAERLLERPWWRRLAARQPPWGAARLRASRLTASKVRPAGEFVGMEILGEGQSFVSIGGEAVGFVLHRIVAQASKRVRHA